MWKELKIAMHDRFVPPSYHRDLRKKLMRLEQGDNSVQDYNGELQNELMRCSVVEGNEDSICRFYSGLRREIQDIIDYKEFNTVNQSFQFGMLAEKELQGREQQSKSKRPAASGVTSTPKAPPTRPSDSGKNSLQVPTKSASSVASSQRAYIATEDGYISTSDIEDEEDQDTDEEDDEVLGDEATVAYRSIIVQWVLSSQV